MTKKVESGRSRLIKGSLLYLWEEVKTMNLAKFKALYRMGTGYVRMKLIGPKKKKTPPREIENVHSGYAH